MNIGERVLQPPASGQPDAETVEEMLTEPLGEPLHREDTEVNTAPYEAGEPGHEPQHRAPKHKAEGMYAEPEREGAYQGTHMAAGKHMKDVPVEDVQGPQPPTPVAQ